MNEMINYNRAYQRQEALEDLYYYSTFLLTLERATYYAGILVRDHNETAIYRALDLAASDPRFELAQQSGWLQQVRDAVTELL